MRRLVMSRLIRTYNVWIRNFRLSPIVAIMGSSKFDAEARGHLRSVWSKGLVHVVRKPAYSYMRKTTEFCWGHHSFIILYICRAVVSVAIQWDGTSRILHRVQLHFRSCAHSVNNCKSYLIDKLRLCGTLLFLFINMLVFPGWFSVVMIILL